MSEEKYYELWSCALNDLQKFEEAKQNEKIRFSTFLLAEIAKNRLFRKQK